MFNTVFYLPLYNALIFLTGLLGGNLGWGVVGLTLVVKIILSPLSYNSTLSQIEQRKLLPYIEEIKKKYPDKKEQADKMNELYKEHKTNPLSGCLLLLLQLPVLFAIFYVFKGGAVVNTANLYSFVHAPATINAYFLGMNITQPNVILLIITAIAQYLQITLSPSMQPVSSGPVDPNDTQAAIAANMQKTMKFAIPVLIVFGGWKLPGAVALYWALSSLFMIAQERAVMYIVARNDKRKAGQVTVIKAK